MARSAEGWTLQTDKRTGNKIAQFRVAGKLTRRSTCTSDPVEAKSVAASLYSEALNAHERDTSADPSLAELFDRWLDDIEGTIEARYHKTQAARALKLAERFMRVSGVTPKAVRAFTKERLQEVSLATVKHDLVPLRECLKWALAEGLIDEPVTVPLPKKNAKGKRCLDTQRVELSDTQVEALIAALPERTPRKRARYGMQGGHRVRDLFIVAWETGLRHGALFGLEAGRHFVRGKRELLITADIDKARFERALPLSERAYQALNRSAPESGPIFERFDYRATLRRAARACKIEGADGLDLRDFRHAATTDMARKAGHLTGTSYTVGHVQQATTSRYVHPRIDDAKAVLAARFGAIDTPCVDPSEPQTTHGEGNTEKQEVGLLAQLVEQRTFNPTVQGSSP